MNYYKSQIPTVNSASAQALRSSNRATPSSCDNVSYAAKSCNEAVKESDDCDFVVYEEIPESVMRHGNNPNPTAIQLTVNTAYQKGMYSNVTS